jgi:hypothetical protein
MQLRFTNYDGLDNGNLLVAAFDENGDPMYVEQSQAMPMHCAGLDDEDGFWTVDSEKLGRITFQSIDLEEDN